MKNKKLVIIGDSAFAEIAYEYFTHDSEYEVIGFSVESAYRERDAMFGLPIVDFEKIETHFDPAGHETYVAIVYSELNRLRTRLYTEAKQKGYRMASYVSSRAFVWRNVEIGEHCFVFEDNTVQPFVKIANNVVLWSGNHIGHHAVIEANCFISSHVVVSGFVEVGANSFLGVNTTVGNNIKIGRDNWIGPGVTINKDTESGMLFGAQQTEPSRVSSLRFFKVKQ